MSREDLKNAVLLRAARNVLNLSLKQVSEQIDVSSTAVGKWENCDATPKNSTYSALQKFFKANGVVMDVEEGEAVIRIKEEALDRIEANPKKPEIKSLQEIYADEMQEKPQSLADLEEMVLKEVDKEIEKDPEFLNKLLKNAAVGGGLGALAAMHPLGAVVGGLITARSGLSNFSTEVATLSADANEDKDKTKSKKNHD